MNKLLFYFFAMMMLPFIGNSQTSYFVSTTGDDSNNGTTIALAWATIQHSMNTATQNSIVNILNGTYNEKVEVNVSGSSGNRIIFQNYDNDVVNITGTGIPGADACIAIYDQSYITIKGLNISDNQQLDAQGILVEGNCQYIEIRDNDISDIHFSMDPNAVANSGTNSQPLIVYGTDEFNPITNLIIDGNIVHDSRTGYSEGLAVNGNVDGFEVTNNTVRDITNIGIDLIGHEGTFTVNDQARNGTIKGNIVHNCKSPYATAAGIYVDGAKDLIIENNTIYQNQWGIEIGCENVNKTTSGIKVRNNLIYDNDDAALAIGGFDYPTGSGKVIDCLFTNNSTNNNDINAAGVGGVTGEINITYTENCTLENNIFYATNTADIVLYVDDVSSINLALDYNQFYIVGSSEFDYEGTTYNSFASYQTGANQDPNSIFSDPQYVDTAADDYHLSAASPARDIGNPIFTVGSGETDIDGENRLQNSRVDMGVDEYSSLLPVTYASPLHAIYYTNYVELKWVSASEINNESYEIQRSSDARKWEGIKIIPGKGNTSSNTSYQCIDPLPLTGVSYYRLKQTDWDGTFSYSNIVTVKGQKPSQEILVYPNPVSSKINIELNHLEALPTFLKIFNSKGQLVLEQEINRESKIELDVTNWPKGNYFIQATLPSTSYLSKVIVFE